MYRNRNLAATSAMILLVGVTLILFGCGGGGGGAAPAGSGGTTGTNGTINGAAVKGPVSEGTVTAFAISNGTMGMQLASATTDSQGNFSMSIGDYTGPLMLQMSGGTYIDEATGATMTMAPGDVMTAILASSSTGTAGAGIAVTPLTSMAQAMAHNMAGGMTDENILIANAAIGNSFMVSDIIHTMPMNPLVPGSGAGATQDMINYGMAIAAMTQYAKDNGMTTSSGIVTAMMNDASDGIMNGMMGGAPITMSSMGGGVMMQPAAGTGGLAAAMAQFMGSAMNRSGLTLADMQALMDHLNSQNGPLQGTGGVVSSGTGTGGVVTSGTGTVAAMMNGMISGTAFNGPMSGGTIMAFAVNNGAMGAQLASGTTDTLGGFSMSIGSYSGPLMLQTVGDRYLDLATQTTMTMSPGVVMTAVIPSVSSGATVTGIQITPLTSMAQTRAQYMTGGMTNANIAAANTAVGNYFMVSDVLHVQPMNPWVPGSGTSAAQDMRDYGITIAAMSQYAKNIGMTNSSGIIAAMMSDASDGVMDGRMGSTQIMMSGMGGGMMGGGSMMQATAGTSGLAAAMTDFMGSAANKSGLSAADMQALVDRLTALNGTIQ